MRQVFAPAIFRRCSTALDRLPPFTRLIPSLLAAAALVASTGPLGCSEANPLGRRAIVGKVTYKKLPVDYGSIQFSPLDQQKGVSSGAMIASDGNYRIAESQGLPPGKYTVMISAPDRKQQEKVEGPPGDERTVALERIPKKYNVNTTLEIEVTKGRGSQEINFDLVD
jgi:hypothetical protein